MALIGAISSLLRVPAKIPNPTHSGRSALTAGTAFVSSRPEEAHLRALPDPYVNLSIQVC
jgi:hypothetical protein